MTTDIAARDSGPLSQAVSTTAAALIRASKSPHTLRAYESALRRFDGWRQARAVTDASVADYLGTLEETGKSPASAATLIAAVRFRAEWTGQPDPVGKLATAALAGMRRNAAAKPPPRGQAKGLTLEQVGAVVAIALQGNPRRTGRGFEKPEAARTRGLQDAAIVGCLFYGGLRRSEVAALTAADVQDAAEGNAVTVRVRRSKGNQDGERADVRLVKNGAADALRSLREAARTPDARLIPISPASVNRRFQAAAREAGVNGVSAHSGRVGLATELIRRGASTTATQQAGGWKTARMVAYYSASVAAEDGAVARYL